MSFEQNFGNVDGSMFVTQFTILAASSPTAVMKALLYSKHLFCSAIQNGLLTSHLRAHNDNKIMGKTYPCLLYNRVIQAIIRSKLNRDCSLILSCSMAVLRANHGFIVKDCKNP